MTSNCHLYALALRDDESPLFTSEPTPVESIEIKPFPFTARRTVLRIPKETMSADDVLTLNYIKITDDPAAKLGTRWYRIIDIRQLSISSQAFEVDIGLDAFATANYYAMKNSSKFKMCCSFSATPYPVTYEPFIPRVDAVINERALVQLPHISPIAEGGATKRVYLVLITGVYKDINIPEFAKIGTFGYPYSPDDPNLKFTDSTQVVLPSVQEILSNVKTYTPIATQNDILDVSVTDRIPIPYNRTGDANGLLGTWVNDGVGWYLKGATYTEYPAASGKIFLKVNMSQYECRTNYTSVSIPLTSDEVHMGTIEVHDVYGKNVGVIDTRLWDPSTESIECELWTTAEPSKVVSKLVLPDESVIEWSEGKLPYAATAYTQYLQSEAQYDREMMQINIDKNNHETSKKIADCCEGGIVNALFSAGIGLVPAAYKAITAANIEQPFNEEVLRRENEAKRNLMKASPSTAYQPSFSASIFNSYNSAEVSAEVVMKGLRDAVVIKMPKNIDDTAFYSYVQNFGYPASKVIHTMISSSGTDDTMGSSGAFRTDDVVEISISDSIDSWNQTWNDSLFNRWLSEQCAQLIRYKKV